MFNNLKKKIALWCLKKICDNPYKEFTQAAQYYADKKWVAYGNKSVPRGPYPVEYCHIYFSWMDGYVKCLHDHGFEFRNGAIVEIDKHSVSV